MIEIKKGKNKLGKGITEIHPDIGFMLSLMKNDVSINPTKMLILGYLRENKEKKSSISDISKDLNIDYKNTWRYIKQFQKSGLIKLNPKKPSQGKKVLVSINEGHDFIMMGGEKTITMKKIRNKKGKSKIEVNLTQD